MIIYDRLWKMMRQKGITQYALINKYHISPAQITRLKRNAGVSTHTIDVFCDILDCKVEDIMEHVKSPSISVDTPAISLTDQAASNDNPSTTLLCAEGNITYQDEPNQTDT